MKKLICFSVVMLAATSAWADLNYDTSTIWTAGPIYNALGSIGADGDTISKLNTYFETYSVMDTPNSGADMGAMYAAALGDDISPVAAVDAGYAFMTALIDAQENENNIPAAVAKQKNADGDENKNNESNGGTSANTSVGDATDMLRAELDAKCSQLNVLKTFVPAQSKLDCARVGDTDAFQCNYSRQYNGGNGMRHVVCTTHNKPFTAHFSSDGKSLLDNNAVIGAFEDSAGANKQTAGQNTPNNKTIVTNVIIAQEIVDKWTQRKCANASFGGMNSEIRESDVKCEMRDNNNFVCRSRYSIAVAGYMPRTCSVGYNGIVYTDGTLGGTFGNVNITGVGELIKDTDIQPMAAQTSLVPELNLIEKPEKTKKEIRQEKREVNKQLREIERAEKAEQKSAKTSSSDDDVPTQVVPISDGTDVDLNPVFLMDEFMDEMMSTESVPTKKEQRAAAREARQANNAQKKQERQENRASRRAQNNPSDDVAGPISVGVDVPLDNLGDLDPVLYQGGYYSNM